jgi:hypothetical protein
MAASRLEMVAISSHAAFHTSTRTNINLKGYEIKVEWRSGRMCSRMVGNGGRLLVK